MIAFIIAARTLNIQNIHPHVGTRIKTKKVICSGARYPCYRQENIFPFPSHPTLSEPRSTRVTTVVTSNTNSSSSSSRRNRSAVAGLIVSPGRTGDRCHCVELLPVTSLVNTVNNFPPRSLLVGFVTLSTTTLTTLNKERTRASERLAAGR